jgi:hypothetical protein
MNRALLLASLFVSACASSSAQAPAAQAPATSSANANEECHEETPIGSSISRRVCRPKAQSDAERDNAQRMMSETRTNHGPAGN